MTLGVHRTGSRSGVEARSGSPQADRHAFSPLFRDNRPVFPVIHTPTTTMRFFL